MNRLNIKTLLLVGGGIALPLVAFAQFRGPSAQPVTNNVPGVIWNASGTTATQPNAQMDFTGTNWSVSPTFKSDIGLSHGRAFRVDRATSSTFNFGNWYSGLTPFTLGVYGGLNVVSVNATQSLGQDGRVQAEKFCFSPGAAANCITAWPTSGSGSASTTGTYWEMMATSTDRSWGSVTYGKGLFVAVAGNNIPGTVMTSPDGMNWTTRINSVNNQWRSVVYGNGLFVAVANSGTGNRVMTSPDGITWTTRTSAADNNWESVTYGNGMYVAVANTGTGNRVMTSADGISWTIRTSAADNDWQSVTYGNGIFVAVSANGTNRVMTSTNGTTWTSRSAAAANAWQSVTYASGLFVAVANSGTGNRVMTSPDGITWTSRTSAADNTWESVTYGNGLFVALSNDSMNVDNIMTSPNGITWTLRPDATMSSGRSVVYGNGMFVAVASITLSTVVQISGRAEMVPEPINSYFTNGLRGYYTAGTGVEGRGVIGVYGDGDVSGTGVAGVTQSGVGVSGFSSTGYGGYFTGTYNYALGTTGKSLFNGDIEVYGGMYAKGLQWTIGTSSSDRQWLSVAYGNGKFVAVGGDTASTSMVSWDGKTWVARSTPANHNWNSVTYGNGLFVAVGVDLSGNGVAMTSPDGEVWTLRTVPTVPQWTAVTYGDGLFVAVALAGSGVQLVMTSPDGVNWTQRNASVANNWTSVVYGNGIFIAVAYSGSGNRVMASSDGITWVTRTSAANNDWLSVTYGNGLFVAVASTGVGNRVMTSPDGITWTTRPSAADNFWSAVAYGNGMFAAVATTGVGNRVMVSGKMEDPGVEHRNNFHTDLRVYDSNPQVVLISDNSTNPTWRGRFYVDRGENTRAGGLWVAGTEDSLNWFAGAPYNNEAGSTQFMLGYDTGSNPHDIDNFRMLLSSSGVPRFSGLTSCSGIQTSSAGTMSCSSDATLKDIRGSYTKGLDALKGIEPKVFSWKKGTDLYENGILNYGFIAQNVQKNLPEAVTTGADGKLQVGTTQILAASVNAINELREENEALKSKVETLEERLESLERMLK